MIVLWLATVVVPATALAWNLSRVPPASGALAGDPAPSRRRGTPRSDFDAGGRVYRAVEAELRALGRLA